MTIPMAGLINKETSKEEDLSSYREAFDHFDWNRSGYIPTRVSHIINIVTITTTTTTTITSITQH